MEFDFDLVADTAISVASEMVDEMSLSPEDARSISMAIKDEIRKLTKEGSYSGERCASLLPLVPSLLWCVLEDSRQSATYMPVRVCVPFLCSDFSSGDEHEHEREAGPETMFSFQRTASTSTAEEVMCCYLLCCAAIFVLLAVLLQPIKLALL